MHAILIPILALVLAVPAAADDRPVPQMTVHAEATVEAVPDLAILRIGVVSERKSAAEASSDNSRRADAVLTELRAAGIAERDIRTSTVSLFPVHDEERDPTGRPGKRTLRGYAARNSIEVRLRDLAKAGALWARLIDRGANEVDGVTFDVSDRDKRLEGARLLALADARRRGEAYVAALGLKLGRVLQVEPDADRGGAPVPMAKRAMVQAGAAVPLAPGTEPITAQVSVTFEVVQP